MKIAFDAKRATHNSTGLGNYSRYIIRILTKYYPQHAYLLYTPEKGKLRKRQNLVINNECSSVTKVLLHGQK